MSTNGEGFIEGMRAKGECPYHPGQPFYHCPECAKERQQGVGVAIAEELKQNPGRDDALIPDPVPVHITQRARDHLFAHVQKYYRDSFEGKVLDLRDRLEKLEDGHEKDITQNYLDRLLENEELREDLIIEEFDVVVLCFLDVTGVSGIHPKIEIAEPASIENFDRDYRLYRYGNLKVAVELQHMNYLRGLIIDWHDRLDGSGFVIRHQKGEWSVDDR